MVLVCLGGLGIVTFLKKSQDNKPSEKSKTYTAEKFEFDYPLDWSIKETATEDETFVQIDLKQKSAKDGEIGKWLKIKVYFSPELPQLKSYPKELVSGQLIIAGKKYDRVNSGSGLFLYNVTVKENDLMFKFSYNSDSIESLPTTIIEAIIQSLRFK